MLQDNDTEMHSTNNERKSVVAERLIRTLQKKNVKMRGSNIKVCIY